MLNEQEGPARIEDAAHFIEHTADIGNGEECPGRHNRIDARTIKQPAAGRITSHSDLRTTTRHYNRARGIEASRAYAQLIAERRRRQKTTLILDDKRSTCSPR
jgi:hypothetical protein